LSNVSACCDYNISAIVRVSSRFSSEPTVENFATATREWLLHLANVILKHQRHGYSIEFSSEPNFENFAACTFGSELTFENFVAATCAWQMGFSNVSAHVVGSSKFNSEPDFENIIF